MNRTREKPQPAFCARAALFGLLLLFLSGIVLLGARTSPSEEESPRRHFAWSRYLDGAEVWSSEAVLEDGWTTIDEEPYLLFIGAGDVSRMEAPDFPAGVRYYHAYFPDYGVVSAREVEPGETWVFFANGKTVIDPIGRVLARRYRFEYSSSLRGEAVYKGEAELGPGWASISFNDHVLILFRSPEALPDEKPPIPEGLTWARLYLPGVGEFYARVDEPEQIWSFASSDYGITVSGGVGTDQP